ncbi:MAG: helix-turn-helix transcriptional regulator [Magnetococcales bacterium]|nr:helix-turn-helix transcriptional regulator [Magnetococcales bacterium]
MKKSIHSSEQAKLQSLLREIRKEAGLRQVELAKKLGKPQSFVSKYESGERRLDLIELHKICKATNFSLVDLAKRFESLLVV